MEKMAQEGVSLFVLLARYQDFQIKNHDTDGVGIMSGSCE